VQGNGIRSSIARKESKKREIEGNEIKGRKMNERERNLYNYLLPDRAALD